jgi:soluble lytic murein transglycosylase-like protein
MPATDREVRSKNPDLRLLDDIERNIAAGIGYARQLWLLWANDAEEPHWHDFMLGSYNAGRTTLLRAQRTALDRGLNARVWPSIVIVAPTVPRWRYDETLNYVQRVRASLERMDASGRVRTP